MGKIIDLTGMRFGRLTVISRSGKDKFGKSAWLCKCDCGNEKTASTNMLNGGHVKSCGCLVKEGCHHTHGMCKTRINSIYRKMKGRCFNPGNKRYSDYGGRGITVCSEWLGKSGFNLFYAWAIANGYSEELSIDRIDVNGNYEPSNCRWATDLQQANNARSNHLINYKGETKTLSEWCRALNINYMTIYHRLFSAHLTVEQAFTQKAGVFNGTSTHE